MEHYVPRASVSKGYYCNMCSLHLAHWRWNSNFKGVIFEHMLMSTPCQWNCPRVNTIHRTPLMISKKLFQVMAWCRTAIIWAKVDQVLWRHMAPLGHNDFKKHKLNSTIPRVTLNLEGIGASTISLIVDILGCSYPDSKIHGTNMGAIWGRQDPGGPHVGPINFAISG